LVDGSRDECHSDEQPQIILPYLPGIVQDRFDSDDLRDNRHVLANRLVVWLLISQCGRGVGIHIARWRAEFSLTAVWIRRTSVSKGIVLCRRMSKWIERRRPQGARQSSP